MNALDFTHFRPQWIYAGSCDGKIVVDAVPVFNISFFYASISELVEEAISPQTRNARERFLLPYPLGLLARSVFVKGHAKSFFGYETMKRFLLSGRVGIGTYSIDSILGAPYLREVEDLVRRFYSRDYLRFYPPFCQAGGCRSMFLLGGLGAWTFEL